MPDPIEDRAALPEALAVAARAAEEYLQRLDSARAGPPGPASVLDVVRTG